MSLQLQTVRALIDEVDLGQFVLEDRALQVPGGSANAVRSSNRRISSREIVLDLVLLSVTFVRVSNDRLVIVKLWSGLRLLLVIVGVRRTTIVLVHTGPLTDLVTTVQLVATSLVRLVHVVVSVLDCRYLRLEILLLVRILLFFRIFLGLLRFVVLVVVLLLSVRGLQILVEVLVVGRLAHRFVGADRIAAARVDRSVLLLSRLLHFWRLCEVHQIVRRCRRYVGGTVDALELVVEFVVEFVLHHRSDGAGCRCSSACAGARGGVLWH